ncbi:helix-turn-helix domain-containing protein [Ferrimicrobium acidiphilum]|uniref:helix-turn-helix domain-containing protein n=1 Tax=Ferrimicrobium acidiphilum TaxID=121039 RepID=UPI0023F1078C|nr:helix-turn-helix domain-containing protein [Ferrimicrobium acidiphilum]
MPENTQLLTVLEAAQELRIARSSVYKLMSRGELKSVHVGTRRLIRRSDLAEFVASLEVS